MGRAVEMAPGAEDTELKMLTVAMKGALENTERLGVFRHFIGFILFYFFFLETRPPSPLSPG